MASDGRDNLIPLNQRTKDEQRKIAAKGGRMSAKKRRENADFKRAIIARLGDGVTMDEILDAMIEAARDEHNVQAAIFLRDSSGQKPTDKQEQKLDAKVAYKWEE